MGLDIVIYKKNHKNVIEIEESLHKEITSLYEKYKKDQQMPFVEKIMDYYKTDIFLQDDDIVELTGDLKFILSKLDSNRSFELSKIIKELEYDGIVKIHIGGD
jgi:hypothetical protein